MEIRIHFITQSGNNYEIFQKGGDWYFTDSRRNEGRILKISNVKVGGQVTICHYGKDIYMREESVPTWVYTTKVVEVWTE